MTKEAPKRIFADMKDGSWFSRNAEDDAGAIADPDEVLYIRADLLATVRREAFKDAQVMMDAAVAGTMASTEFHKGFEAMRRLAKRVLERAAASVL